MSYSAQYRQFLISYRAVYGCEPSPDEIAAFNARHNHTPSNSRDRTPVPLSFQTAGSP